MFLLCADISSIFKVGGYPPLLLHLATAVGYGLNFLRAGTFTLSKLFWRKALKVFSMLAISRQIYKPHQVFWYGKAKSLAGVWIEFWQFNPASAFKRAGLNHLILDLGEKRYTRYYSHGDVLCRILVFNGSLNGCFENDNIKFIVIMSNKWDPI